MAINWPTDIPFAFLYDSFSPTKEDNRIKYEPPVGGLIMRDAQAGRTDTFSGYLLWTSQQRNAADSFYTNTLVDGALSFVAPHPITKELARMRIAAPWEMQAVSHRLWRVLVQLEILPGN